MGFLACLMGKSQGGLGEGNFDETGFVSIVALERAARIELATSTLEGLRSTTELRPQTW